MKSKVNQCPHVGIGLLAVPRDVICVEIVCYDGVDGGTKLESAVDLSFRQGGLRVVLANNHPEVAPDVF